LIADEICWRWSWQAWHAWCANLSGILSHLQNSAAQTPEFPMDGAPRSGIEVI